MSNPVRPGVRPGQRPTTVGEPHKQPAPAPTTGEQQKPHAEQSQAPQLPPYGPGIGGQQNQQREQSSSGAPGCVSPRDVFQLAMWSVTPPYDDQDMTERKREVRAILQQLIDDVTEGGRDNENTGSEPQS